VLCFSQKAHVTAKVLAEYSEVKDAAVEEAVMSATGADDEAATENKPADIAGL
jgi:hypothetical protein